jgi:2'-5' RNA ligase
MRLFVAVELDQAARAAAGSVVQELRGQIDPRVSARWVNDDKMHLTVRFIGHVDDERAGEVLETLRPPLPIAAFDIAFGGCGVFPRSGPPRVLWIGLKDGHPCLQVMHDEFNRRLLPLGFAPENRPFSAHLTLARVKDAPRDAARALRTTVAALRVSSPRCQVTAATVFRSSLSPKGSTYTRLLTVPCNTEV